MKLRSFLSVKAVVCLIFGIGFVLMPVAVMSVYGATLETTGVMMSQFFGAIFFGIGIICWLYRNEDSNTLKGMILALCIADTIGFVVALIHQLSGNINAVGWINVALWLLFALGLAYFRILKPSAS